MKYIPLSWFGAFLILPMMIIGAVSVMPNLEYKLINLIQGDGQLHLNILLNLSNYLMAWQSQLYQSAYFTSVLVALGSTILAMLIGFPIGYGIAIAHPRWRPTLLMLVMVPFWTSFLIRIFAWMSFLSDYGALNSFLMGIGLLQKPIAFLYNPWAVCLGISYCYLPFMILPIYVAVEKIDSRVFEAAYDLGARPWKTFFKITLPLARGGLITGATLVFVPAIGEYVIPELIGGPSTMMIGRVLWIEFFTNRDWPLACALAIIMVILFVGPIMLFQRIQDQRQAAS